MASYDLMTGWHTHRAGWAETRESVIVVVMGCAAVFVCVLGGAGAGVCRRTRTRRWWLEWEMMRLWEPSSFGRDARFEILLTPF